MLGLEEREVFQSHAAAPRERVTARVSKCRTGAALSTTFPIFPSGSRSFHPRWRKRERERNHGRLEQAQNVGCRERGRRGYPRKARKTRKSRVRMWRGFREKRTVEDLRCGFPHRLPKFPPRHSKRQRAGALCRMDKSMRAAPSSIPRTGVRSERRSATAGPIFSFPAGAGCLGDRRKSCGFLRRPSPEADFRA
jgi:hypothetical protein